MANSEHQHGQSAAFPPNDLTRRLMRRATDPIGVIDVRHAVGLHARSDLWPAQRLGLLDNLKRRYGVLADAGGATGIAAPVATGLPFVSPLHRTAASSPVDRMSPSVSSPGSADTAAATVSQASSATSASQYRVRRPDSRAPRDPAAPSFSDASGARSPAEVTRVGVNASATIQVQRKTSDMPSPAGSAPDASPPVVRAAALDARWHTSDTLASDGSFAAYPLPQAGELPIMAASMIGRPSTSQALGRTSAREDRSGDAATSSIPSSVALHLQRKANHPSAVTATGEETGRFPALGDVTRASTRDERRGHDAPTSSNPSSRGLQLQRMPDHPSALPLAGPVQTAEAKAQFRGAVAAEVLAPPQLPGSASIVWRKADANGASRASATSGPAPTGGPTYTQIMRQSQSEPTPGSIAPVATAAVGNNGVDITRVADQVGRMIARQLRIERERRGMTR